MRKLVKKILPKNTPRSRYATASHSLHKLRLVCFEDNWAYRFVGEKNVSLRLERICFLRAVCYVRMVGEYLSRSRSRSDLLHRKGFDAGIDAFVYSNRG